MCMLDATGGLFVWKDPSIRNIKRSRFQNVQNEVWSRYGARGTVPLESDPYCSMPPEAYSSGKTRLLAISKDLDSKTYRTRF